MGRRINTANLLELVTLSAVAAPFVGFGASEITGSEVLFILGAGVFCTWMFAASFLLVGRSQNRSPAPVESVE